MAAVLEPCALAPAAYAVHNSDVQGLYAIVDMDALRGRSVTATEVAAALIEGGASTLQLRAKGASLADMRALAAPLAELVTRKLNAESFFVNDAIEIALELGVGVHLGQEDRSTAEARALAGARPLRIGRSTHNLEQMRAALREPNDYLALGPVFATASKERPDPVIGAAAANEIAAEARRLGWHKPLVAIGGIDVQTSGELPAFDAVAVISAPLPERGLDRASTLCAVVERTAVLLRAFEQAKRGAA
jgi:thiamine-phosphate pyrophosphorylase